MASCGFAFVTTRHKLPFSFRTAVATFFLQYCTVMLDVSLVVEYACFLMLFGNTWSTFCTLRLAVAAVNHTGPLLRLLRPKRTGTIEFAILLPFLHPSLPQGALVSETISSTSGVDAFALVRRLQWDVDIEVLNGF